MHSCSRVINRHGELNRAVQYLLIVLIKSCCGCLLVWNNEGGRKMDEGVVRHDSILVQCSDPRGDYWCVPGVTLMVMVWEKELILVFFLSLWRIVWCIMEVAICLDAYVNLEKTNHWHLSSWCISSSFQHPMNGEMNIASGCPLFIWSTWKLHQRRWYIVMLVVDTHLAILHQVTVLGKQKLKILTSRMGSSDYDKNCVNKK